MIEFFICGVAIHDEFMIEIYSCVPCPVSPFMHYNGLGNFYYRYR